MNQSQLNESKASKQASERIRSFNSQLDRTSFGLCKWIREIQPINFKLLLLIFRKRRIKLKFKNLLQKDLNLYFFPKILSLISNFRERLCCFDDEKTHSQKSIVGEWRKKIETDRLINIHNELKSLTLLTRVSKSGSF